MYQKCKKNMDICTGIHHRYIMHLIGAITQIFSGFFYQKYLMVTLQVCKSKEFKKKKILLCPPPVFVFSTCLCLYPCYIALTYTRYNVTRVNTSNIRHKTPITHNSFTRVSLTCTCTMRYISYLQALMNYSRYKIILEHLSSISPSIQYLFPSSRKQELFQIQNNTRTLNTSPSIYIRGAHRPESPPSPA